MKIALAIDNIGNSSLDEYFSLCQIYKEYVDVFKIGLESFIAFGPQAIIPTVNIFLDLKFHDIPNTVGKAVARASSYNVKYLTVHGTMESEALKAAAKNALNAKVLAVTKLTSANDISLNDVKEIVDRCLESGITGFVCPASFSDLIKSKDSKAFVVSPGIRFEDSNINDQVSVSTPQQAYDAGVDMIVLGRTIFDKKDPISAINSVQKYRIK